MRLPPPISRHPPAIRSPLGCRLRPPTRSESRRQSTQAIRPRAACDRPRSFSLIMHSAVRAGGDGGDELAPHGWLAHVRSPPHPVARPVGARATAFPPHAFPAGRGRRRSPSPRRGEGARRADEGAPLQPRPRAQPSRKALYPHVGRRMTRHVPMMTMTLGRPAGPRRSGCASRRAEQRGPKWRAQPDRRKARRRARTAATTTGPGRMSGPAGPAGRHGLEVGDPVGSAPPGKRGRNE